MEVTYQFELTVNEERIQKEGKKNIERISAEIQNTLKGCMNG